MTDLLVQIKANENGSYITLYIENYVESGDDEAIKNSVINLAPFLESVLRTTELEKKTLSVNANYLPTLKLCSMVAKRILKLVKGGLNDKKN